jgi:hypothetical protein
MWWILRVVVAGFVSPGKTIGKGLSRASVRVAGVDC